MGNALQDSTGSFCMAVSSTSAVWPIDGTFPFTNGAWSASARSITKSGAFTNMTFKAGSMVYITSPVGVATWTPGFYEIESKAAGNNPIVLKAPVPVDTGTPARVLPAADNSTTCGFVLPNGVSGNWKATSTTASESILANARGVVIEGILLTAVDASSAATISILGHDGTTVIHSYAIAANASGIAYPIPLPLGVLGRRVIGGISAKTSVAGTTFEVFGRAIL